MGSVKVVKASAGSGKTYRLAYEYIVKVIENPWLYRGILAVTFTNKATEEMKGRIIEKINGLARGDKDGYMPLLQSDLGLTPQVICHRAMEARTKILHDYSHFTIVTIDKFFQRIIRAFIKELGMELNFNLELQTDSILERATERLIDEIATNDKLRAWVMWFVEEKIDRGKKWEIKGEIAALGSELFKEAFKNRTGEMLSREELSRLVNEVSRTARQVKEQMQALGEEALTLMQTQGLEVNDFAYKQGGCTGYFTKMQQGLVEAPGKRVRDALGDASKWYSRTSARRAEIEAIQPRLETLLEAGCTLYDENYRFLKTTALLQENFRSFALLTDLSAKISEICAQENILPISETNTILSKLISGNDTPFIYEKVGNRFSHFLMDEFQDTSTQQWNNFVPLLENAVAQSEGAPVLLVGDIKQSIYRWRGGDWQILGSRVGEHFPDITTQTLEENYRSQALVVEFNNRIISAAVQTDNALLNQLLVTAREAKAITPECATELTDMLETAYMDHVQQPTRSPHAGYVRITALPTREITPTAPDSTSGTTNDSTQTEHPTNKPLLIKTIEEIQARGYAPNEVAILVRRKAEGRQAAQLLLDYKAMHPDSPYCYDVVTQEALMIGNAPVVTFVVALFYLAVNPQESIKQAIYNQFLGFELDRALDSDQVQFLASLRLRSIEEAFEETLLRYKLHQNLQDVAYIQALQEQIHTFATHKIADIPLFLKWWEESGRNESINLPDKSRATTIITIHKAKGLQYKVVIIPACDWELTPLANRTLLWAGTEQAPFNALGKMPIRWKKEMGDSYFAPEYFREAVLSHIDNINTFYVATTRAVDELHIFTHGKPSEKSINGLILGALERDGETGVNLRGLTGSYRRVALDQGTDADQTGETSAPSAACRDFMEEYAFGEPMQHPTSTVVSAPEVAYPSRRLDSRLTFRMESERYFADTEHPTLSPRNYGILMHKLFESIDHSDQIEETLTRWRTNAQISDTELIHLRRTIAEAFKEPLIASWFSPQWSEVRNEQQIVVPGEAIPRRPDRVLTRGREAVVIDYKFGHRRTPAHARQISQYVELLTRMGYRNVTGYLWYVEEGEVVTVVS